MHRGYVKLWRRIDTSEVSSLPHSHFRVWCWILTNVTHKATTVAGINLEPGEMLTTYGRIAMGTEWKENRTVQRLTTQQLRTATQHLVKLLMLELQQELQQGCLRLKVLHWEEYQGTQDRTATGTATELQQDFNRTATPEQEGKKVKKVKNKEQTENLLSEPDGSDQPIEPTNGKGKGESIAALATGLWGHWLDVWPEKNGLTFTGDRRRAVEARLREGIKPEVIRNAINQSKSDPWWSGAQDGKWKADIKTICGKGSTVENLAFDTRSMSAVVTERAKVVSNLRAMLADGREEIMVRGICEAYEERGDHEALWQEVTS